MLTPYDSRKNPNVNPYSMVLGISKRARQTVQEIDRKNEHLPPAEQFPYPDNPVEDAMQEYLAGEFQIIQKEEK